MTRPRYPVIDCHNHLDTDFGGGWIDRPLNQMHEAMDAAGVTHLIDLDGGWGEAVLRRHLEKLAGSSRFRVFGGIDWNRWPELGDGFPEYACRRLETQRSWGASGLKVWKPFGLQVRDERGSLVAVDDARLAIVWETAGRLGWPVLIHVADPVAFFDPIDETNERWDELSRHPEFAFASPPYPSFLAILEAFKRLVARHPSTVFVGAHVGCYAENLAWVAGMLDSCPNYFIDLSGRMGELGRQPYSARDFLIKYSTRILFGLDTGIDVAGYRLWYRFLETADECFNYCVTDQPMQGRWPVHALSLPEEVLHRLYRDNAARVLGFTVEKA
ncbi:MAG TPA: amidohydrolase family protein [Vicinamibacterales bacterium]|nr:amidohydrolase family protein [Vicinamibacterales bacterium]